MIAFVLCKLVAGLEQKAVQQLAARDREPMLPVLELQDVTGGLTPAHVVAALGKAKVGDWPIGLDLGQVQSPVTFVSLMKYCIAAAKAGHVAYPVVNAPDLFGQLTSVATLHGASGVVLRLRLQMITLAGTRAAISGVRKAIGKSVPLHVIYDFGAIGEVEAPHWPRSRNRSSATRSRRGRQRMSRWLADRFRCT